MQIHIRLAEPFWRPVGQRDLELDLADGARVSDLLVRLAQDYPGLAQEMDQSPPHVFIEEVQVGPAFLLTEGARVHLLWPVAGG